MGMRPTDKDTGQEHREVEKHHETAHRALCVEAVTRWNTLMERRYKPRWSPMIGVAIVARFYFLDVHCPGCRQLKKIDLRTLDRHAQTTLHGLIPMLSCRSCQPSPPFAQLVRLSEREWQSLNAPAYIPPKRGI